MARARQRLRKIQTKVLVGGVSLCAVACLAAGCGAGSVPHSSASGSTTTIQYGPTQRAHQTPSQSNPDIGAASSQRAHARVAPADRQVVRARTRTSTHAAPGASRLNTGRVVQTGKVTPASSDDTQRTGAKPLNPCGLVTVSEARSITGGAIVGSQEAPLGPTCIYRASKANMDVTVAVETQSFKRITREMKKPTSLSVSSHQASCGKLGREMMFLSLPGGRVLNITASCGVARRFAALAVSRLTA